MKFGCLRQSAAQSSGQPQRLRGGAVEVQLREVAEALAAQLQSDLLDEAVAEQAVKGLVFVARVYNVQHDDGEEADSEKGEPVSKALQVQLPKHRLPAKTRVYCAFVRPHRAYSAGWRGWRKIWATQWPAATTA
jgi:hypothetical protein